MEVDMAEEEEAVFEEVEIDTSKKKEEKEKVTYEVEEEVKVEESVKEPEPEPEAEPAPKETKEEKEIRLEELGKEAQKRINELTRRRKEAEEALARKNVETAQLEQRLTEFTKGNIELREGSINTNEKILTQQLEMAKQSYLDAYDSGNKEQMLKAQEVMSKSQVDLSKIGDNKSALEKVKKEIDATPKQPTTQPIQEFDPRAVEWSRKKDNTWFGQDQVMTASALAIDLQLKQEGYDPSSNEFYEEVDKRMRENFPHKFGESQPRKKTPQVVAGQSRSQPKSKSKVKLTQDDVRLAKKWKIPLEKYAAEKIKAESSSEYTTIDRG
tara:strand:+ start:484 stop:1461 length:978 start_codon:yes stop_codon:yes gene_type:complete